MPTPLVNEPVYDLGGRLLGIPDLFDPATGTASEYNGEVHLGRERRRKDVERAERFRDHGIESVDVVAGDSRRVAAARMVAAHGRALARSERARRWTVERPVWDPRPETLDEYFDRTGRSSVLGRCEGDGTGDVVLPRSA